jgi:hypothetical protein
MRIKFLILAFLATFVAALAIPTMPGIWRMAKLANGTQIRLEQVGDENLHYWRDARGICYNVDDNGVATPIANMQAVRAHAATRMAQNNARRSAAATRTVGISHKHVGKRKGLIVLANFTDAHFQPEHTNELLTRMANEVGFTYKDGHKGSLHDYFKAQSNGLFDLTFDVVGPVQLKHNMAYYGRDTLDWRGSRTDIRAGTMVAEACKAAIGKVNFRDYDWDGDGAVDQVLVIFAGYGQASGGNSNTIWPHEWALQYSDYGKYLPVGNNMRINTYACSNELNFNSTKLGGFGTACHEFTHCLGLPDMYDTSDNDAFGTGYFDVMSVGSYNNHGYVPAGYTSYEKMFVGWLKPHELTRDTVITGMKPMCDHGDAYLIRNDANADEYYLLENRRKKGWDAHLPGEGLVVLHVDFDQETWLRNGVNATPGHKRCAIVPADNRQRKVWSAQDSIPYPQAGNDSLTATSLPATEVFTSGADETYRLNKSILGIRIDAKGDASFRFRLDDLRPKHLKSDTLFYESFNKCEGKGGNDGLWGGFATYGEFKPDNDGWTFSVPSATSAGRHCAVIGTGEKYGVVENTPVFYVEDGSTISFKVAAWGNEDGDFKVESLNPKVQLSQNTFKLPKRKWQTFKLTVKGAGYMRLTMRNSQRRFFLDELLVKRSVTNSISTLPTASPTSLGKDGRIYSLDGVYMGTSLDALDKGVYIIDGKKVVK